MTSLSIPTFEEYRDFLTNRGLTSCNELLNTHPKDWPLKPFYEGAIEEFRTCQTIVKDILDLENRYRLLLEASSQQYWVMGPNPTKKQLVKYWSLRGQIDQADFLLQRLKLLYLESGDLISVRAFIDFRLYLIRKEEPKAVEPLQE